MIIILNLIGLLVQLKCKLITKMFLFHYLFCNRDTDNKIGKEIISRFTIKDFDNGESFFTDSNGRELIKRQLNKRSDYEYDSTLEPVSSNYYPVTSKIVIKDEKKNLEVAVLNDRAQGGSSLQDGAIELMVVILFCINNK